MIRFLYYIFTSLNCSMMIGQCLVDGLSTVGDVWPMLGRRWVDFSRVLVEFVVDLGTLLDHYWLYRRSF